MKRLFIIILIYNILILCSCDTNKINYEFSDIEEEPIEYCLVDLRGEVIYPGIYKVKTGSLIVDVINLAGGFTNNANIDNINLVSSITSNTKLTIPSNKIQNIETSLININTASIKELTTLPKIGDAKAQSIIEYREKNGGFKSIEEIKNISGIGESLYEAIKDYITV